MTGSGRSSVACCSTRSCATSSSFLFARSTYAARLRGNRTWYLCTHSGQLSFLQSSIHHRSLQLHPISSNPFCLSGCLVGCIHPLITAGLIYLAAGKLFDFPKLQLQHLASGRLRWNSIRAALPCWPGHHIGLQAPGETTTEFISNFSSYLTEHEWDCIVRAGTPAQVLMEFYRYSILFLLEF